MAAAGREVEYAGSFGTLECTNLGLRDGHRQVFVAVDTQHAIDRINPSPIVALAVETGKGIALEQSTNDLGAKAADQLDAVELRAKGLERQVMRDVVGGTAFVAGQAAHQDTSSFRLDQFGQRFLDRAQALVEVQQLRIDRLTPALEFRLDLGPACLAPDFAY